MAKKWIFLLSIVLISSFSFFSSYGEEKNHANNEMEKLLQDENKYIFLTNKIGTDFTENFSDQKKLGLSDNNILIKSGTTVILKGSQLTEFSTILVEGNLRFDETENSSLKVQKIIVAPSGEFSIGTEEKTIEKGKKAEISFIKKNEGEIGIFVFGKLIIHGYDIGPSFSELASDAKIGDKRLVARDDLGEWENGKIVVTSPGTRDCNEEVEIKRIDTIYISLKEPLLCYHRVVHVGEEKTIGAHIAFLNRNVKFSSENENERASINFFHDSSGYIKYAELDLFGPKNVLARYPIHFHHMKDTSRGIEVIGNAITNSENRWITIHDSNGILVKNNVGYKAVGHGFFLEDGNEFDNVFEKNIGIITSSGELIESDRATSIFWTMNPMNVYRGNVAVDGKYWGFIFHMPNEEVFVPNYNQKLNLRSLPSLEISDNIVYNYRHGAVAINRHTIQEEKIDTSEIIISNLFSMNSYLEDPKQIGIRVLGSDVTISNSKIFNNKIGIELFGARNNVEDTNIEVERRIEYDTLVSGIVIAGKDHIIKNVEIKGYVDRGKNFATDISLSDSGYEERLLSAKIVNVTLLDPNPIFFGEEGNDDSFLEIYGHNMPNIRDKNLPENFILKKIGSDIVEERGEYNNLEFMAMIKMTSKPFSESFEIKQYHDVEIEKIEAIKSFKNNAFAWKQNRISDDDFSKEIEFLVMENIINVAGIAPYTFGEYDFTLPDWMKNLVAFWSNNAISDKEFMNAIEYILELQLDKRLYSYN